MQDYSNNSLQMYKEQEHTKSLGQCATLKITITPAKQILNHFLNGFIYTILMQGEYQRY